MSDLGRGAPRNHFAFFSSAWIKPDQSLRQRNYQRIMVSCSFPLVEQYGLLEVGFLYHFLHFWWVSKGFSTLKSIVYIHTSVSYSTSKPQIYIEYILSITYDHYVTYRSTTRTYVPVKIFIILFLCHVQKNWTILLPLTDNIYSQPVQFSGRFSRNTGF